MVHVAHAMHIEEHHPMSDKKELGLELVVSGLTSTNFEKHSRVTKSIAHQCCESPKVAENGVDVEDDENRSWIWDD